MDHDSGYISSESSTRPEEEKFVISEIIPNAENSENAIHGTSDLKTWEVVTTSFMNIVNKDDPKLLVGNPQQIQTNNVTALVCVTPKKKFDNPINPNVSPDLFADEDTGQNLPVDNKPSIQTSIVEKNYIVKKDFSLVKRTTNCLKGVIPPHCMTIVHLSLDEMLNKLETNKEYFWNGVLSEKIEVLNTSNSSSDDGFKSLLITGNKDITNKKWPDILQGRFHGLQ